MKQLELKNSHALYCLPDNKKSYIWGINYDLDNKTWGIFYRGITIDLIYDLL